MDSKQLMRALVGAMRLIQTKLPFKSLDSHLRWVMLFHCLDTENVEHIGYHLNE